MAGTRKRMRPDRAAGLIRTIYSAATDNTAWNQTLAQVDELFDASGSFFCARPVNSKAPQALVSRGIDPQYFSAYQSHYYQLDILAHRAAKLPRGRLYANQEICDDNEYLSSEIYRGLHQPQDIRYGIVGSLHQPVGELDVDIGVLRGHKGVEFTSAEARAANDILPHIHRSLELSHQLHESDAQQRNAYVALDQLQDAIAVCGADGSAHFQNKAFETLASHSRLLHPEREHKIIFRDIINHRIFRQLRNKVMDPMGGSLHGSGSDTVCLHDRDTRYLVRVQPWINQQDTLWGTQAEPGCMVFIRKAGAERVPSACTISDLHAVSLSEAEIGHHLCRGLSIDEIARERGVAASTVRQQVKSMMRKLNCHKQGELIAYLLTNTIT